MRTLLLGSLVLIACGTRARPPGTNDAGVVADAGEADSGAPDSGMPDSGMPDSGEEIIAIPDPGTADADWGFGVNFGEPCCSTPGEAYPVGIVDQNAGYVQGNIDMSTGDFFYVFRTGSMITELAWTGGIELEYIHLHDGDGLIFGPEIPPIESTAFGGRWPVETDHVYVLELHSTSGGFF